MDAADQRRSISPGQIRKIHALKGALGLSDEGYRAMVQDVHGFSGTSKDLSYEDAGQLIRRMEDAAVPLGVWRKGEARRRGGGRLKYDDLAGRQGFASPAQLRMIEAMWKDVSRAKTPAAREKALRAFLYRMVKVSAMEFIERRHVQVLIKALEQMRRKEGAY